MSSDSFHRPPAKSWEEVDTHLIYAQGSLQRIDSALSQVLSQMATKSDLEALGKRFDSYATKQELASLREELIAKTPASLWAGLARVAGQLTVVAAAALLLWNLVKAGKP